MKKIQGVFIEVILFVLKCLFRVFTYLSFFSLFLKLLYWASVWKSRSHQVNVEL